MIEFYNHRKSVAIKDHTCEYCGKIIHKGEKYSYESGKYDGDFFVRKLCHTCYNILQEYCSEEGAGEFVWEYITEWLQDGFCVDCKQKENDECECTVSRCPRVMKYFEKKQQ